MALPPAMPAWLIGASPALDATCKSMNSYAGRDKVTRTLAFMCALQAQRDPDHAKEWAALGKQCSSARLVFRQFNHSAMIKALQGLWAKSPDDEIESICTWTTAVSYSIFGVVELGAWLADAKIISGDAAKMFRICLYLWFIALLAGIVKQLRVIVRKGFSQLDKIKDDALLLLSYACDFLCAGNAMPAGLMWSGRLPSALTVRLSLIASVIGLYRTL